MSDGIKSFSHQARELWTLSHEALNDCVFGVDLLVVTSVMILH
jgi:hypothetical protein